MRAYARMRQMMDEERDDQDFDAWLTYLRIHESAASMGSVRC